MCVDAPPRVVTAHEAAARRPSPEVIAELTALCRQADRERRTVTRRRWTNRLTTATLVFALTLLVGAAAAQALGYRLLIVRSGSMTPTMRVGDAVLTRSVPATSVKPGNIVTFADPALANQRVTHRVTSVRRDGSNLAFVTRGDANHTSESWTVPVDGRLGKEIVDIPSFGRVINDAKSRDVLLALLLAFVAWMTLLALKRIWRRPAVIAAASLAAVALVPTTAGAWVVAKPNSGNSFATASTFAQISSIQLKGFNPGTNGMLDKNDSIILVFSKTMSVASFCSIWAGDGNNQSLAANNDVTVTATDGTGGTNDSLTVSSASCAFNFGTLDLGSNNYVSGGNATFGGSSSNKSTIQWVASTNTLTVTLGGQIGGTVNTVASSTAVYTASPSIRSANGGIITNSPYALAAGQNF
jgi:signal peptidase I